MISGTSRNQDEIAYSGTTLKGQQHATIVAPYKTQMLDLWAPLKRPKILKITKAIALPILRFLAPRGNRRNHTFQYYFRRPTTCDYCRTL